MERAVKESEALRAEDERFLGKVEAKNRLESLLLDTRSLLRDEKRSGGLSATAREKAEEVVRSGLEFMSEHEREGDKETFDVKFKEVSEELKRLVGDVVGAEGAAGTGGGNSGAAGAAGTAGRGGRTGRTDEEPLGEDLL
jgi:molecular chaperone DnaK (HSP70)